MKELEEKALARAEAEEAWEKAQVAWEKARAEAEAEAARDRGRVQARP